MGLKRTITLTNRPPVRIDEDRWPLIADAKDSDNRANPSQANRQGWVKVRRHEDGRTIVYGGFDTSFPTERDIRVGFLLDPGVDPVRSILDVCEAIGWPTLAPTCIADLPAEELT